MVEYMSGALSMKKGLLIVGILVVVGVGGWVVVTQDLATVSIPSDAPSGIVATTTPTVPTTTLPVMSQPRKILAPEPAFTLPVGATAIDEYAFIIDNVVYFRSLINKEPLKIPNSEGASFKRLNEFVTYPGTAVLQDCGAAPVYTYYGDNTQVYFYQIWRAPEFRTSQIEVVVDAKMKDFQIIDALTAVDANRRFTVGYTKATTTCKLYLTRTDR